MNHFKLNILNKHCKLFCKTTKGAHHADRLVNPKVLAQKNNYWFYISEHVDSEKLNRQNLQLFSKSDLNSLNWHKLNINPALRVWVAFLKQPTLEIKKKSLKKSKKIKKIKNHNWIKSSSKKYTFIFGGRSARQCIRLFQKSDPNPQCNFFEKLPRNIYK
jgi:hypothetical protein